MSLQNEIDNLLFDDELQRSVNQIPHRNEITTQTQPFKCSNIQQYKNFKIIKKTQQHQQKQKQVQQQQKDLEAEELKQISFQPTITKQGQNVMHEPIWTRSHRNSFKQSSVLYTEDDPVLKQQFQAKPHNPNHSIYNYVKKKQEQEQLDVECTFKPKINKNSEKLYQKSQFNNSINNTSNIDKYQLYYQKNINYLLQKNYKIADQVINQTQIQNNKKSTNNTFNDFIQRQQHSNEQKQLNMQMLEHQINRDNVFQPQINLKSQQIVKNLYNGQSKPVDVRMHEYKQKIEQLNQQYNQFNFQPQINETSRQLVKNRQSSIEDYKQQQQQRDSKIIALTQQFQREENNNNTFQPNINSAPSYLNVTRKFNVDNLITEQQQNIKQREQQYLEQIRKKQENEMRECTFQPQIYSKHSKYADVVKKIKNQ